MRKHGKGEKGKEKGKREKRKGKKERREGKPKEDSGGEKALYRREQLILGLPRYAAKTICVL